MKIWRPGQFMAKLPGATPGWDEGNTITLLLALPVSGSHTQLATNISSTFAILLIVDPG